MIQCVGASSPASIVLVDDSKELRLLYSIFLAEHPRAFRIVGEAVDGRSAVKIAQRLHPDLMLLDVSMPGMGGLEALPLILRASPATRVYMLSGYDREWLSVDPISIGACGVIAKSASPDEVIAHLAGQLATG